MCKKKDRGFTLIELLIAMTIFAIGLLSLAGMQISAIRTNSSAQSMTAAAALAEGILEEILAMPANDDRLNESVWQFGVGETTKTIPGAGTYEAQYSVVAMALSSSLARVDVSVRPLSGSPRGATLTGVRNMRH